MLRAIRPIHIVAACGLTCSLTSGALAQPAVISISGATLLENIFRAPANTVDFIDADGNGIARRFGTNQQLAPMLIAGDFPGNQTWPTNLKWSLIYTAVGSTNGYQELINFGRTYVTVPGTNNDANLSLRISVRTAGYYNRYRFISAGTANVDGGNPELPPLFPALFNDQNPGGYPVRSTVDGTFRALYTSSGVASTSPNQGLTLAGGMTVDIAPLDVPTTWATTQSSIPGNNPFNTPLLPGYGNNLVRSRNADGSSAGNNGRMTLASLTGGAVLFNGSNGGPGSVNTIFDTDIVVAPVAPITNFGTGIEVLRMTDLRFLFATGRLPSGENIVAVTRDSGSGTRNAFDNSIGLDPSFAIGDNLGPRNNAVQFDRLGAQYVPSNKQGNNRVEPSVYNHRLAIGYVGPERGIDNADVAWLSTGHCDIVSVINDLPSYGATNPQPVRPTINALLDNNADTGWNISGPSVFATFGDPRAVPASKGGYGYVLGEPTPSRQGMRNVEAAAYINNYTRSIDAFIGNPGGSSTFFTPGEFAADQFLLPNALDFSRQSSPGIDPRVLVANANLNQFLQDYIRSNSIYTNVRYATFGGGVSPFFPANSRAGKVPLRTVATTYSDQALTGGAFYAMEDATTTAPGEAVAGRLSYGNNLPLRNLISGDFNGDGRRDLNDAGDLVRAWRERTGGPNWTPPATPNGSPLAGIAQNLALLTLGDTNLWPTLVSPGTFSMEIVGDFNGDGSFNVQDLRYWADGLAMTTGASRVLDRKAGFSALDNELLAATGSDANLFDTRLVTPCRDYAPGDARGDVANASGRVTRGFSPIGADGLPGNIPLVQRNVIDANDIDYVFEQFRRNPVVTDGELNWGIVTESRPSNPDATASDRLVGGDLSADINGDLKVNQADVVELVTVILKTRMGDVNLDGNVNGQDGLIIQANLGTAGGWARGDLDGDGTISSADLDIMYANACIADVTVIGGAGACPDLVSAKDGQYTVDDIIEFFNNFGDGTGCPGTAPCNVSCDVTGIGGWPELPDGQLTVDDVISFINAFSDGCL